MPSSSGARSRPRGEPPDRRGAARRRVAGASPGRRESNKLDKRQRIRQATRELFSAHGFEAATLRRIAERARVGLGTLFQYARDKRDLTFLLFNEDLARLVDEAIAASSRESRVLDQVMAMWEPHYRFFAKDPVLCRILLRDMYFYTAGGEALRFSETAGRLRGHLASVVAAARERGDLARSASAADLSALLFAAFESAVRDWMREEAPVAGDGLATLRRRVRLLLRAFVSADARALQK
ncbi:MAG: TetR/AcrR family transcriptional regulator [Vicinamibacteria bacterium]